MTELRRDVLLPFAALMVILVLTSTGTVALLARMAPAIERIVSENLYSLEAAESMLVAVSRPEEDGAAMRFATALARAESNVSERREQKPIADLRAYGSAAFAGDRAAKQRVISAVLELARINRAAVVREDERAQRLGYAGAWAAVFLGALSFGWALLAAGRARRRLIDPLHEITAVLDAAHMGDSYRRCRHMAAPAEVKKMMTGIDELLDARALRAYSQQPTLRASVDRQVLLFFLEQFERPAWVLTANGSMEAANGAGLALLAGEQGAAVRQLLAAGAEGEVSPQLRIKEIEGADRFVCELLADQ